MSPISKETARDIALAYREIEAAEALLADIAGSGFSNEPPDLRDVFGRRRGLQLGVPSGSDGHRLFDVPLSIARPIIEAHIATHKARIGVLTEKARLEIEAQP